MPAGLVQKMIAIAGGDLRSPTTVADIDEIVRHLLETRKIAVSIHGDAGAAPEAPSSASGGATGAQAETSNWTVRDLIDRYRTDERSPYQKLRYRSKENYGSLIKRIAEDCGDHKLADLKTADIQGFYEVWKEDGKKIPMAHGLATILRALINFGAATLQNSECERLSVVLHNMRFKVQKRQAAPLTAEHVNAIIHEAHRMNYRSIALAQAFQFDCKLRQKDVIGEWVPIGESGTSDVRSEDNKWKWLRGLHWSEIDKDLVLRHPTSKGGKVVEFRLTEAPLVMAELSRMGELPQGRRPVIVFEKTGLPYQGHEFRYAWRKVADAARIPKSIKNMDSRASGNSSEEGIQSAPRRRQ
jgi:hypothetical protein